MALLAIPNAVAELMVQYLLECDVVAMQRTHPRFRKAFIVKKIILRRTLPFRLFLYCRAVLPVKIYTVKYSFRFSKVLGIIPHLAVHGTEKDPAFGPIRAVRNLGFVASHLDIYAYISKYLKELCIDVWSGNRPETHQRLLSALDRVSSLSVLEIIRYGPTMHFSTKAVLSHPCVSNLQECILADSETTVDLRSLPSSLRKLNLSNCEVTDISSLARLVFLERLVLTGAILPEEPQTAGGICAILAQIPRLTHLNLGKCDVADASPLAAKSWYFLGLEGTQVEQFDDFRLTRIRTLRVTATPKTRGLQGLSGVRVLRVESNPSTKVRLAGTTNVRHLHIYSGEVSISDIAKLRSLISLNLNGNTFDDPLETLSALGSLPDLRDLTLKRIYKCQDETTFRLPALRYLNMGDVTSGQVNFRDTEPTIETLIVTDCQRVVGTIVKERCPRLRRLILRSSPMIYISGA
jgi:hypothetical protein